MVSYRMALSFQEAQHLSLKRTAKKYSKTLGDVNMSFYILMERAKGEKFRLQ
jgi:hypothetical protein